MRQSLSSCWDVFQTEQFSYILVDSTGSYRRRQDIDRQVYAPIRY